MRTSYFLTLLASAVLAQDPFPLTPAAQPSSGLIRVAKTPTVAVLEFTSSGSIIPAADLQAITSRFEAEVIATDSFRVVERRNIARILKEQGFQQSGACDNSECQVEVGQLLGVQYLFSGEVTQMERAWSLVVKRTDVGTAQTVFSHVLDIRGSKADLLRGGVTKMARIATGQEKAEKDHSILVAQKPIWPWILGGAVVAGAGATAAFLLSGNSHATVTTTTPSTNYNTEVQWETTP